MKYVEEYRAAEEAHRYARALRSLVTRPWTLMEVCGGQTHAIVRFGIDQLLRDLVPKIASIGLLLNPNNPNAAVQTKEMQAATTALGLRLNVLSAGSERDFDNAFAALVQQVRERLLER